MKNTKSFKFIFAIFAVLVSAVLIFFAAFASGCGNDEDDEFASQGSNGLVTGSDIGDGEDGDGNSASGNSNSNDEAAAEEDLSKALTIPVSNLTTKASFFGINVDGTYMEVIAFKSGSAYRTAFNTCQVCYGSPKAYFLQSGSNLVCQNCGNKFALSNVGVKNNGYGCNPYPILDSDRTYTGTSIIIPYDFLVKAKAMFKIWKAA